MCQECHCRQLLGNEESFVDCSKMIGHNSRPKDLWDTPCLDQLREVQYSEPSYGGWVVVGHCNILVEKGEVAAVAVAEEGCS